MSERRRPSFKNVALGDLRHCLQQRREGHETKRKVANSIKKLLKKVYMKNVALSKSRIFWTWLIKCLKTDIRFLNVCQKTLIP